MKTLRIFFRILNRFFMVPIFRLGLGSLMVNPVSGYIMVLKTIGRKTGKPRYVPVNYAIDGGCIYCLSGWGKNAHWYANLHAHPEVEAILPGGTVYGETQEIADPIERLRLARKVMISSGFIAYLEGVNPYTCSDEKLAAVVKDTVLFRIRLIGIGSGPLDPGGLGWVGISLLLILLTAWLIVVLLLKTP
jgi:deazaflavin-dependent oxidoreductase (nitroreductase family)